MLQLPYRMLSESSKSEIQTRDLVKIGPFLNTLKFGGSLRKVTLPVLDSFMQISKMCERVFFSFFFSEAL